MAVIGTGTSAKAMLKHSRCRRSGLQTVHVSRSGIDEAWKGKHLISQMSEMCLLPTGQTNKSARLRLPSSSWDSRAKPGDMRQGLNFDMQGLPSALRNIIVPCIYEIASTTRAQVYWRYEFFPSYFDEDAVSSSAVIFRPWTPTSTSATNPSRYSLSRPTSVTVFQFSPNRG